MIEELKTDYKDDVLATSQQGKRTFNIVGKNGEILFEDVHIEDTSRYLQVGDEYGQSIINEQNSAINQLSKGTGYVFDTYADYLEAYQGGEIPIGAIVYIKEGSVDGTITALQVKYNDSNVKLALDTLAERLQKTVGFPSGTTLIYKGNLNDVTYNSLYNCEPTTATNLPLAIWGFLVTRVHSYTNNYIRQDYFEMAGVRCWTRIRSNGTWGSWKLTDGWTYRGNAKNGQVNIGSDWDEVLIVTRNYNNYSSFGSCIIPRILLPTSGYHYARLRNEFFEGNVGVNQSTVIENHVGFGEILVYTK